MKDLMKLVGDYRFGRIGFWGMLLWLGPVGVCYSAQADRPNVLVIYTDEQRADCFGLVNPSVQTPNMDRLAREGVRFSRSYVSSPSCTPARMCLFTGRYPEVHGVMDNNYPAREGEITLPMMLRHYGYRTLMAGKLHFYPATIDHGFDRMLLSTGSGASNVYAKWLRGLGLPNGETGIVPGTEVPNRHTYRVGVNRLPDKQFRTAWTADQAIELLTSHRKSKDQPFFLFCSFLAPHSPYIVPKKWAGLYDPEKMEVPKVSPAEKAFASRALNAQESDRRLGKNLRRTNVVGARILREVKAKYYAQVTMMDHHMGRVLDALDALELADETLVIFSSDHGNLMGEHARMFKGLMFEGSIQVPLIVRYPKRFGQDKVIDDIVDNVDVLPTILELCGIPIPAGIQGDSLVKLMTTGDPDWPNVAYGSLWDRMIRTDRFKLILPIVGRAFRRLNEPQLYDLRADPGEHRNLYSDPAFADVRDRLKEQLSAQMDAVPPRVTLPRVADRDSPSGYPKIAPRK